MADFLKSAANYFSSSTLTNSNGAGDNPLIGTVISVNSLQLRIKRQIGEGKLNGATCFKTIIMPSFVGGFAFVFIAQDIQSGQDFALKVPKDISCYLLYTSITFICRDL